MNNATTYSVYYIPSMQTEAEVSWNWENIVISAYKGKSPTYTILTWNEIKEDWDAKIVSYDEAAAAYDGKAHETLPTVKQLLAFIRGE